MSTLFPKHLENLKSAIKQVKKERVQELRAKFPPWYVNEIDDGELSHSRKIDLSIGAICAVILLLADRHIIPDPSQWSKYVLYPLIMLFISSSAIIRIGMGIYARKWVEENPLHPYVSERARYATIQANLDPDILKREALNRLSAYVQEQLPPDTLVPTHRTPAIELTHVRIAEDITALQAVVNSPAHEGAGDAERYEYIVEEIKRARSSSR